jgi:nucleotide-binding universal stress UspA family protein
MYDDILVPCDGSPEAENAAGHAIGLAEVSGARIHALYVVDDAPSRPGPGLSRCADLAVRRRERGESAPRGATSPSRRQ